MTNKDDPQLFEELVREQHARFPSGTIAALFSWLGSRRAKAVG